MAAATSVFATRSSNVLRPDQRLAVALVLVEGMSYKEAAEVLEIPTARSGETSRELRRRNPDGLRRRRARRDNARRSTPPSRRTRRWRVASNNIARCAPGSPARSRRCWTSPFPSVSKRLRAPARAPILRTAATCCKFPARSTRAPSPPWRAREWVAMAASLLLGVLLSWRMLAPARRRTLRVASKDALVARGELARALDSQLASEQRGEEPVLIGLTFKARDGNYCRSFVLRATRTAGLACRVGSDWQVPATDSSLLPEGRCSRRARRCRRRSCEPSKRGSTARRWTPRREARRATAAGWNVRATVARMLEQVERIHVQRPAQVARRLDRFHARQPLRQQAMQRRALARLDQQLRVVTRRALASWPRAPGLTT